MFENNICLKNQYLIDFTRGTRTYCGTCSSYKKQLQFRCRSNYFITMSIHLPASQHQSVLWEKIERLYWFENIWEFVVIHWRGTLYRLWNIAWRTILYHHGAYLARFFKLSGQICWQCQLIEMLNPLGVCSSTVTIAILCFKLKKSVDVVYQKQRMRLVCSIEGVNWKWYKTRLMIMFLLPFWTVFAGTVVLYN